MTAPAVKVLGYARTPFGKFGGPMRVLELPELGAIAVRHAMTRAGVGPGEADELVLGVNFPGSERSVARQVQLRSEIPEDRVAYTVDRACCSSMAAISLGSRSIRLGEAGVVVAGGVENLSRVPYFLEGVRFGERVATTVLTDELVVSCPHTGVPRAVQASAEAALFGVARQEQDEWALRSQTRYAAAKEAHGFPEIVPVTIPGRDSPLKVAADEPPRPSTTLAALTGLPTIYGSATVTAGNAPDLSTGAAALVLASSRDPRPAIARLSGWAMVSGDPQKIASMPGVAGLRSLDRLGLTIADVDLIEINEAFAAVPLVSTIVLGRGDRQVTEKLRDRTNVNGGAIAVGHPTGATGARLVMTIIEELQRRGGGRGLVCICGGIGEAEAVVVEVRGR